MDDKEKEKQRGRSRRAETKKIMLFLDNLCDDHDDPTGKTKRPRDRRGALGSGRTVPELLQKARDVVARVKKQRELDINVKVEQTESPHAMREDSPAPGGALSPDSETIVASSAPCGPGLKPSDCRIPDSHIAEGLLKSESLPVFAVSFPDCRVKTWNQAMQKHWQPSRVVEGQPFSMLVHPEDFRILKMISAKCVDGCKNGYVEVQVDAVMRLMYLTTTSDSASSAQQPAIPCYAFSPVKIGTVSCVRESHGSALAVFVVEMPQVEVQPPPVSWNNYLTPEACWKLSGVWQFDGTFSKDSPLDVMFELRKNKISIASGLKEESSGLASKMNDMLSMWIKGCCRSVANPILQLLRFHVQLEYRENACPWMRVHSTIAWHSKWTLAISCPIDATFFSSSPLKMADGWEHTLNATLIQGIRNECISLISQEWRVNGATGVDSLTQDIQSKSATAVKTELVPAPTLDPSCCGLSSSPANRARRA